MKNRRYDMIPKIRRMSQIFGLRGRAVVIAGGAGKMGAEFAMALAYAGARVAVMDLDEKKCAEIAKQISSKTGSKTCGIELDASDKECVEVSFKKAASALGRPTILIYNVMAKPEGYYSPIDKYTLETWKKVLDGNLTGAFLCCRKASEYMKKAGGGSIVLTSSTYGLVAPDQRIYKDCKARSNIYGSIDSLNTPAVYSASKAALIGLARHLASLWGKDNIRVNVLTPGGVYDGQENAFHKEYVKRVPLGRMATWSDYNGAALFLASDASRYMTGANLVVDGGWTAW